MSPMSNSEARKRAATTEGERETLGRALSTTTSLVHVTPNGPLATAVDRILADRSTTDTLSELRALGNSRRERWHTPDTEPWTGADWSNAMCGEAGEAANVVKKIRRIETGTGKHLPGTREHAQLVVDLAHELADTIAYADILAQHYGIDLRTAIAEKFNIVSEREGFPERMSVPSSEVTP